MENQPLQFQRPLIILAFPKKKHDWNFSSWWFQPFWKILVKIGSFHQVGVKIKHIWNHHPVLVVIQKQQFHGTMILLVFDLQGNQMQVNIPYICWSGLVTEPKMKRTVWFGTCNGFNLKLSQPTFPLKKKVQSFAFIRRYDLCQKKMRIELQISFLFSGFIISGVQ